MLLLQNAEIWHCAPILGKLAGPFTGDPEVTPLSKHFQDFGGIWRHNSSTVSAWALSKKQKVAKTRGTCFKREYLQKKHGTIICILWHLRVTLELVFFPLWVRATYSPPLASRLCGSSILNLRGWWPLRSSPHPGTVLFPPFSLSPVSKRGDV